MSWKVAADPWFGCQIWQGSVNNNGYPTDWSTGKPIQAYLVAWTKAHGCPLPDGKELDHLCRRRLCVATAHLEVVSRPENQRRKFWAHRSQRSACGAGHELHVHGRRTPEGGMICRICSGVWTRPKEETLE